jgi:hypothetical protein
MPAKILSILRKTARFVTLWRCVFLQTSHGTVVAEPRSLRGGLLRKFGGKAIAIMKKIAAALMGIPLVAAAPLVSMPARTATDDDAVSLVQPRGSGVCSRRILKAFS